MPLGGLAAGLAEHPVAELAHEAGALGQRQELAGRDEAVAVLPADERLDADDLPRLEADERLVVEHELLLALEGAAEAAGHRELGERVVALEGVDEIAVAAVVLRLVHGGVRVLEQRLGVGRVEREEADADARAHEDLDAGDDERLAERAADPAATASAP